VNIVTCKACGSSQTRKPRPCIKCGAELPVLAMEGEPVKSAVKDSLTTEKKKSTRTDAQKAWDKIQTAIQATVIPDNDLGLVSFKDRMQKK